MLDILINMRILASSVLITSSMKSGEVREGFFVFWVNWGKNTTLDITTYTWLLFTLLCVKRNISFCLVDGKISHLLLRKIGRIPFSQSYELGLVDGDAWRKNCEVKCRWTSVWWERERDREKYRSMLSFIHLARVLKKVYVGCNITVAVTKASRCGTERILAQRKPTHTVFVHYHRP